MGRKVLVIGAGNGGSVAANELAGMFDVTVVEPQTYHFYQPSAIDIITGDQEGRYLRPVEKVLDPRVKIIRDRVTKVIKEDRAVVLRNGEKVYSDYLVIAPGAVPTYKAGSGSWHDLDSVLKIRDSLGGVKRVIVGYPQGVIKCPIAPWEMSFLLRDKLGLDVTLLLPMRDVPKIQQPMAERLGAAAKKLGVKVIRDFKIGKVEGKTVASEDGEKVTADLVLIDSPVIAPREFSDLTDKTGFIHVDRETLKVYEEVFAVGDVTNITVPPKTGSSAHFQASVVAGEIMADLEGTNPPRYRGDAVCVGYMGKDTGMEVWMNFERSAVVGPTRSLASLKRIFGSIYWATLRGKLDPALHLIARNLSSKAV